MTGFHQRGRAAMCLAGWLLAGCSVHYTNLSSLDSTPQRKSWGAPAVENFLCLTSWHADP